MMHNPPHPGKFIKEICLKPLNLSITEAAKYLGVTRKALSELINEKSGISPEMALRLAKAFNTTPESWLTQQAHYDLWKAKNKAQNLKVKVLWKSNSTLSRHAN